MAITIDRNGDDTTFQRLLESLKNILGKKSGTAAIKEAIRYYVVDRPEILNSKQELLNDLEEKTALLEKLYKLLENRRDAELELTREYMNYKRDNQ